MIITLVLAVVLGLVVTGWFVSLEGRGARHRIAWVLLVTLIVEAVLAGPASQVPRGLLRPVVAGQDFRPVDLIIVSALIARLFSLRVGVVRSAHAAWCCFAALYVMGVGIGLLRGLPTQVVLFQGKALFYLIGGMVIASGVLPRPLARGVATSAVVLAPLVPISMMMSLAGVQISLTTPVQRLNNLGRLSNDSVTLLTVLGGSALIFEALRSTRRPRVVVAGIILLMAPLAATQRASYLSLLFVLLAGGTVVASSTWSRRSRVTYVEILLAVAGVVGTGLLGLVLTSSPSAILKPFEESFSGAAEARSAASRFELADQAISVIAQNPVVGNGVGSQVVRQGAFTDPVPAAAHNLVLDLGMRVGVIGLSSFFVAVLVSTVVAWRGWRTASCPELAALAASSLVTMSAVLGKGLVEPALDKFRLSLALGIAVGFAFSVGRLAEEAAVVDEPTQGSVSSEPGSAAPDRTAGQSA